MNLSQLYYFQVVAEEEHISHAAEKLHISQPSLSTTIRRLENELDTPLFDRRGRNIYLNDAGRKLLEHVHFLFGQIELLKEDLADKEFYMAHGLTMAVNNTSFLEGWIADFIKSHQDTRITQLTMPEEQMMTALQDEKVDFILGDFSDIPSNIQSRVLLHDEYLVAMPENHPLAVKETLLFEDIANEPFSSFPSNSVNCFINLMFAQKKAKPNVIFEGQLSMMFKLLAKGHALMFTSKKSWEMYMHHAKESDPKLFHSLLTMRLLPVEDLNTQFDLSVCWKKDRDLPIMAKTLLKTMVETFEKFQASSDQLNNDKGGERA